MKTYYCVTSSVYDDGRVRMFISDRQAFSERPKNTSNETARCDVYNDWFDTERDALDFIKIGSAS